MPERLRLLQDQILVGSGLKAGGKNLEMIHNPEILCSVNWQSIGQLSSALLTPAIAAIAVYIAYQQYVTNRSQYRLALFERRMKVFDSVMNLIASILRDGNVTLDRLFQFVRETRDHELLFGPEVGEFINELYRNGVELRTKHALGTSKDIKKETELLMWFSSQTEIGLKHFRKYLDFRKP